MRYILLAAALTSVLAAPGFAAGQAPAPLGGDQEAARQAVQAGRQVPLSRVLKDIAQHTPGRQLNTTMGDQGGRKVYLVQWQRAKDGHIVVFVVDAESGQMLGQQGG